MKRVVAIVKELLRCQLSEKKGKPRALELNDILVVAPYNMQLRRLQEALPQAARVGSVDKFLAFRRAEIIKGNCYPRGGLTERRGPWTPANGPWVRRASSFPSASGAIVPVRAREPGRTYNLEASPMTQKIRSTHPNRRSLSNHSSG